MERLNNINNSILSGRSAMPQKAATSLNENNFSMNRVLFAKTIKTETLDTIKTKHFFGERNRDASSVIQRSKIISAGGKNASGENISHQGTKSMNDVRQAQQRVRNRGYVVPPKITASF